MTVEEIANEIWQEWAESNSGHPTRLYLDYLEQYGLILNQHYSNGVGWFDFKVVDEKKYLLAVLRYACE